MKKPCQTNPRAAIGTAESYSVLFGSDGQPVLDGAEAPMHSSFPCKDPRLRTCQNHQSLRP